MKIIRLESENVKRLRAVEIRPDGNVVVISGRNAQGKTSVLDSIEMALGGQRSIPPQPIREGQRKARVVIETESMVIRRTFTNNGTQLVVEGKDGSRLSSPQAILDSMVGKLSFNPLRFIDMGDKDQAEELRRLLKLDFTAEEDRRRKFYEDRRDVNREIKTMEANLEALDAMESDFENVPAEEISLMQLVEDLQERQERNRKNQVERNTLEHMRKVTQDRATKIKLLEQSLVEAQEQYAESIEIGKAQAKKVEALVDADTQEVERQIEQAEETNRLVRKREEWSRHLNGIATKKNEAEELSRQIANIDAWKKRQLSEAKMPVDGLEYDFDRVLYRGKPFSQASRAEQIRVSVAMGAAFNPALRIMLIRDGSLLDDESMKLMAELAAEQDLQLWLERVGDEGPASIVIEDGQIMGSTTGQEEPAGGPSVASAASNGGKVGEGTSEKG